MKIVTIVGTRPEIIRLSCIMMKLDKYFQHIIIHTGQNWDPNLNEIFFRELNLRKPDYQLNIIGKNLGESMGNIISQTYDLLSELKPDALLVLGDTNSSLSTISAKRLKIPIFHMEAGNRCFDQIVPEEINRRIIDHVSDINLCYTEHSRRNLLREGMASDHVIVTGSPLREVYEYYNDKINQSNILETLNLEIKKYILWSTHREENIDIFENWNRVIQSIQSVSNEYRNYNIIVSTHPRTRKKILESEIDFAQNVILHDPFGLFDYIKLQKNAYVVISDSGTISEEAAILQIPAISFRFCTERPEAIDKGNIVLSGLESQNLLDAVKIISQNDVATNIPTDYLDNNVSDKIVKIILSYTSFVNRMDWRKT